MNRCTVILVLPLLIMSSCVKQNNKQRLASCEETYEVPKYTPMDDGDSGPITICDIDEWLYVPEEFLADTFTSRLVDAYNLNVVWHDVMSDFEFFWRFEVPTVEEIRSMQLSVISDDRSREKAEAFRTGIIACQQDTSLDVNVFYDKFLGWICEDYNVDRFIRPGSLTDSLYSVQMDRTQWVPDFDSLYAFRGKYDTLYIAELEARMDTASSFSARCIYAVEHAHATFYYGDVAESLRRLESVLTAGVYSPLLGDTWRTWRALLGGLMGASKDSYIPNEYYNRMRMICCYTMLCHIRSHPDDTLAINNFLTTSFIDNIQRYGNYIFGNQMSIEKWTIFSEWLSE